MPGRPMLLDWGRVDRRAREAGIAGPIGREAWRTRLPGEPVLEQALAALAALEPDAPPLEMQRRMLGLLDRFEVAKRILDGRDAGAYRALVEVLAGVTRGLGAAPVSLSRYAAALRVALSGETFSGDEREERGRVLVLAPRDVRGLRFEHVFFGGLSAASFPPAAPADIFCDEEERRALGLATARERLLDARELFADALAAARHSATLSYAAEGAPDHAAQSPLLFGLGVTPEPVAAAGPRTSAPAARVARAVLAAHARLEAPEPGRFEGVIGPVPLPEHVSPTDLERYVACPFRAFAERRLGLAPLPEVEEEVSAREAGEVIHRILKRFYDGFARGSGDGWLAEASARMLALAREELSRTRDDAFWRARGRALTAGLDAAGPGRKGVLRAFLEQEAQDDGRAPAALESWLAFELEQGGARVVARGVVDRIDREREGGGFVVYDYKTGKRVPEIRDVLEGRSFQLPIYLLAAGKLAGGRPLGAAYYPLSDPADVRPRWFAGRAVAGGAGHARAGLFDDFEQVLERVPLAIGAALEGMARGLFHPGDLPPERKGCSHCDVKRVCRVDDGRMRRIADGGAPAFFRPLPLVVAPESAREAAP